MVNNENQVNKYLNKLGLNSSEIYIYLKLLSSGASTIADIVKKSEVPRTTVKRNIYKLMQKGMVAKTTVSSVTKYIAENPKKINQILNTKEIKLEDQLKEIVNLKDLLPTITNEILKNVSSNNENSDFIFKYYQGKQGFIDAHNRTLESKEKELYFFSNMDEWKKVFTDDYAYKFYVPERINRKIFAKTLAIKSSLATTIQDNDKKNFREMRFLPSNFDFKPTIIVYDSEVLIFISTEPHFSILIQYAAVAKLFKDIFNYFWLLAEK